MKIILVGLATLAIPVGIYSFEKERYVNAVLKFLCGLMFMGILVLCLYGLFLLIKIK